MKIHPAIDLIEGKCVRLSQGDYERKRTYSDDPLSVAKSFEDAGLSHLHLVDLEGAKAREPRNLKTLEAIARGTRLIIDYGGGMYSDEALRAAFDAGASYITCGSTAVKNRELALSWMRTYGEKIILGADCIDSFVASAAWSEKSSLDVVSFINSYSKEGIKYCICTDVAKDGMMAGPSFALYEKILKNTDVKLIASGGISCLDDLARLKAMGLEGAIVGKAYYEGAISLFELKEVEDACQANHSLS